MGWDGVRDIPLTTGEFGEGLFPDFAQADFHFETVANFFALGRVQLCGVAGQEVVENQAEIFIDLRPSLVQGFALVVVKTVDRLLDLLLVLDHRAHHLL